MSRYPPRSRLRAATQNLGLLIASTLFGLLAVELVARGLYERPWYDHLLDVQATSEADEYRLNSFGLRGDDFVTPKPVGERRVYMAGDSFTFGMGVADGALVMPSLVQDRLNGDLHPHGAGPVGVLNAGMLRGSLPRHWLRKWHEVGDSYDPDVVLVVFFLRDGTDTGSIPAFFGTIRSEIAERNAADPFYRWLYALRTWRDFRDRKQVSERYTLAFREAYFGSARQQKEWRSAQHNVLEIKREAEERGAAVGFVIYPILVDLGDAYPFQDISDLLEDFADRAGMPTLNLLPSFLGESGPDLWVSPFDQHPNARGHAIAARAVAPFVAGLLVSEDAGHAALEPTPSS